MSLVLAWIVAPAVLVVLCFGCGLLAEASSGIELPIALVGAVGLATVIVAAGLATASEATAQFATPLVIGLAVLGFGVSVGRLRRPDPWLVAAVLAVFCVYAAPIVLSGAATFAGYITLDDTATWLALADNAMTHGRSVSGLAPSTYQQVLTDYLPGGVPLGAEMPLGVTGQITRQDGAWLLQPTFAVFGATLASSIWGLGSSLVPSRPWRAIVAFLGAQAALLYAYAFWAGLKELAAAAMIALVCAIVPATFRHWRTWRGVVPAGLATAALLAILTPAGAVWLIVPGAASIAALLWIGARTGIATIGRLVVAIAVLSIPSILIGYTFLHGAASNELTSNSAAANLGHPLSTLQLFGIWPATDFRQHPHDRVLTYAVIALMAASAVLAIVTGVRSRRFGVPLYAITCAAGALIVMAMGNVGLSSPWLIAKAMAEASPALVTAGVAGAAIVFQGGRRTEGVVLCAAIAAGVLGSNALAYSNVWLAPRSELAELQTIGGTFAGDGPTLMTEYQPYGVRHFLRRLDPEAASERRRRLVPLLDGSALNPGESADLDAFQLDGIEVYRTIVLRRSPVESRPPSVYNLVWRGHWYEVWRRPAQAATIREHVGLGTASDPAAVPACSTVASVAAAAASAGGQVAAVIRPQAPVTVKVDSGQFPRRWTDLPDGTLVPHGGGEVSLSVNVPTSGVYGFWLGGSLRRTMSIDVDGRRVGSVADQLNNDGQWTPFGTATLAAGTHQVVLTYGGSRVAPGQGGLPFSFGPLVLSTTTADVPVRIVAPAAAQAAYCGRRLDWLEAVGG